MIDPDYRGPVGVVLFNFSDVDFTIKVGDRIAQLIIEKIETPDVVLCQDLDTTERGAGGFGSTGGFGEKEASTSESPAKRQGDDGPEWVDLKKMKVTQNQAGNLELTFN